MRVCPVRMHHCPFPAHRRSSRRQQPYTQLQPQPLTSLATAHARRGLVLMRCCMPCIPFVLYPSPRPPALTSSPALARSPRLRATSTQRARSTLWPLGAAGGQVGVDECRVWGAGCGVPGVGCRVWGAGARSAGARSAGARSAGAQSAGARSAGARSDWGAECRGAECRGAEYYAPRLHAGGQVQGVHWWRRSECC